MTEPLAELSPASDEDEIVKLRRRIEVVEGNASSTREKQFLRLGALAAVISTFLSIYTGVTQQVAKKRDDRSALYQTFSGYVTDMLKADQLISEENASQDNDNVKRTRVNNLTTQRFYSLTAAEVLYPRVETLATAPQLVELALAESYNSNIGQARIYLQLAIRRSDQALVSETLRMQGRVLAGSPHPSDRSAASQSFTESLADAQKFAPSNDYGKSLILHDWALADVFNNDCVDANTHLGQFLDVSASPTLAAGAAALLKEDIKGNINSMHKCMEVLDKLN